MAKNNWTKVHREDAHNHVYKRYIANQGSNSARDKDYYKLQTDSKNVEIPMGFAIKRIPEGKKSTKIKLKEGWF